jgi:transposase
MFIREKKGTYQGKTYINYQLVESVRTPHGPRQKVICSLGNLKPRPWHEWLKLAHKLESALVGQMDLLEGDDPEVDEIVEKIKERRERDETPRQTPPQEADEDEVVQVKVNSIATELHREAGPVHVGYQYWKKIGMDEILAEVGMDERSRTLTCLMTMNRLFSPASENAMPDWMRRTALGDILGVDLEQLSKDSLYRNLDLLHLHRQAIEAHLARRERNLFNLDQTIFLYDLTSTYFEGQADQIPKAKLGYSRDKRPDCKQLVVGLVVNRDGFPLAHEIFEGNILDHKTLPEMLDQLDKRVKLEPGRTVVVDRGMAYDENREQIKARGLHYLVASRQAERDKWLAEFEQMDGFQDVPSRSYSGNSHRKGTPVKVKMKRTEYETHVLCLSQGRKEKDRAIREKQEKRLLGDLARLEKRVADGRLVKPEKIGEAIGRLKERYPRVARYYGMDYDPTEKKLTCELDTDKRSIAEKLDGSYLLKTDRKDLSAEEAWTVYTLLTRAEEAFRAMKSPLAERPIFHHLPRRVETHIFLCLLAYHILVAVEKTLHDKGLHTSFATVREQLKNHDVCTTVLPASNKRVLRIRKASTPEPHHTELYRLLGVPGEIIRPTKTWSIL